MKSKSSCISMVCVSLTNAPQVTNTVRLSSHGRIISLSERHFRSFQSLSRFSLQPSDALSCRPDSVVAAVLSTLKICAGSSSPAARSEVSRNIIGSSRVQRCALEALAAFVNSPGKCLCVRFHFTSSETADLPRMNWICICFVSFRGEAEGQ